MVGDVVEEIVWQVCLVCGYEVDGFYCMQGNYLVVFMVIVYYVDGMNWQEYGECLVDFVIQVSFVQFFDEDSVCMMQQVVVFFFYFVQYVYVKVGVWEWVMVEYVVWQVQFQVDFMYFVFEQFMQWFNQVYFYFFWQVVYVVVRFDDVCFIGGGSGRFDNVRVDGILCQLFDVVQFQCFFVEYFYENVIDNFMFCFWIVFICQCVEEMLFVFNVNNVQVKVVVEYFYYLLCFVQVQQIVVYEYVGQVFVDSVVQQYCGY